MFWRGRGNTEVASAEGAESAAQTVEIVRQARIAGDGALKHWAALAEVTGRLGIEMAVAKKLVAAGCPWFVGHDFVDRFKYVAALRGNGNVDPVVFWASRNQGEILYVGDVPQFALERAQVVLQCGIRYLTVHSAQPLPMTPVVTDPVLLGWVQNPRISAYALQHPGDPLREGTVSNPQIAVVVSAWDLDKELEVL